MRMEWTPTPFSSTAAVSMTRAASRPRARSGRRHVRAADPGVSSGSVPSSSTSGTGTSTSGTCKRRWTRRFSPPGRRSSAAITRRRRRTRRSRRLPSPTGVTPCARPKCDESTGRGAGRSPRDHQQPALLVGRRPDHADPHRLRVGSDRCRRQQRRLAMRHQHARCEGDGRRRPEALLWLAIRPDIKAHARVEIHRVKDESGFLPLAVPEIDPAFTYAIFVDYSKDGTQTPLAVQPLKKDQATVARASRTRAG